LKGVRFGLSRFDLQAMFQLQGRSGQVPYLACGLLPSALLFLCLMIAITGGGGSGAGLTVGLGVFAVGALAAAVVMGVGRLHDLGRTGWLAAVLLIPVLKLIVGLWLLVAPGEPNANRYGQAPGRDSRAVVVLAWAVPVMFIAAILAAIALTPHKSETQRAHDQMEQAV
jgi:uncharacterized membrane protein YhaH (DUF805 family)